MPKLASRFSSTVAPLLCPRTRTFSLSIVAKPPMSARSSLTRRSPCSSSKSEQTWVMKSLMCGRFGSRASLTLSIAVMDCSPKNTLSLFTFPSSLFALHWSSESPVIEHFREELLEILAFDDLVDEAVLLEIFGGLEVGRKLLVNRVLDHAPSGESDQRLRLGDVDVAEHRIRRAHAARGGIGQDAHVGKPRFLEARDRRGRLRHLHERENALVHAGAARGREEDQRTPLGDRLLAGAGDAFAGAGSERAAHEPEVHDAEHHRVLADLGRAHDDGLGFPRFRNRLLDLGLVGTGRIVKLEMVGIGHGAEDLRERAFVSHLSDALAGREPAVVVAFRADAVVFFPDRLLEMALARGADRPQRLGRRNLRFLGFGFVPGHVFLPL